MTALTLVADENILGLQDLIRNIPDLNIKLLTCAGRQISAQALADADVLFVRSVTQVNEALLKNSPVQFVGTATAGLEHIDTAYLKQRGIHFCSAQGANANAVAEYVLTAMAYLSREQGQNYFSKKIGIVGHGHVGKTLEHKLRALGSDIRLYDPWLQKEHEHTHASNTPVYSEWNELLECGVISFHVPLVKNGLFPTEQMMDKGFFSAIADNCLLVNAARGEICDEAALLEKIKNSQIKTVWDVWNKEPGINQQLLAEVDLASPHVAGYSLDAKLNASQYLLQALCDFMGVKSSIDESANTVNEAIELDVRGMHLFDILLHAYNPCDDSRRLKDFGEGPLATYFDALRKNYRHRLEWRHYHISGSKLAAELEHHLKGLGFSLD